MARKNSFILYTDNAKQINLLNDAQAGLLFKALLAYAQTGEEGSFQDGMVNMLYSILTAQMERDAAKYQEICEKRKEAARKGGAPKGNQNAAKTTKTTNCYQMQAKQPDTDTDTVSDTVTDTETVSESVCVNEPETETAPAGGDTHNTTQTETAFTEQDALQMADVLGYHWDQAEAAHFLAYNKERKRTSDWFYAVKRWEAQRRNHPKPLPAGNADADDALMNEYLSLVNRFREDEESAGID